MIARFAFSHRHLRVLAGDERGATAVEFGLVFLPFTMLLMGSLDLGYQAYLRAQTNGVLERAARRATIGNLSSADTDTFIRTEMKVILPASVRNDPAAVQITKLNYYNFSAVGGAERITGDTAPVGSYNSTDCYEDRNNNGRWDATGGGNGLGGADDIVYYQVKVTAPRLFPLFNNIGWGSDTSVYAKTLIRNQPFADQTVAIRCS